MALKLDSKIPAGELAQKWSNHKAAIKVVSPANKRKLDIIIVGLVLVLGVFLMLFVSKKAGGGSAKHFRGCIVK